MDKNQELNDQRPQQLSEDDGNLTEEVSYYTVDVEKAHVMSQQHHRLKDGVENIKAKDRHMWNQVKTVKNRRHHELPRG